MSGTDLLFATIGELCEFSSGHGFRARDWSEKGWPIIRIQNLNGNREFNYFGAVPEPDWVVEPGQLLFAWAGTRGVSFGPVVWNGPRGVLNQHIYRVHPKVGVDKHWLHDALLVATARIERKAHGFKSSLVHVHKADITGQKVFSPPIGEQRRIAATLERWDHAISLTERLIAAKQQLRRGLMQQLLTGKRRFPGFSAPWREVRLGVVTSESTARNHGRLGRDCVRAVTNSVGMVPMHERLIAYSIDRYKIVQPSGFAYNPMRINVGSLCMWTGSKLALVSPDYVVFECEQDKLDPHYFNILRETHRWDYYMQAAGNGSVRVRIWYDDLAALHFELPPLGEQRRIATFFGAMDRELTLLQTQLTALRTQKRGLMQQLLTGKVRVPLPAQDAEPAPAPEPTDATDIAAAAASGAEASA